MVKRAGEHLPGVAFYAGGVGFVVSYVCQLMPLQQLINVEEQLLCDLPRTQQLWSCVARRTIHERGGSSTAARVKRIQPIAKVFPKRRRIYIG